MNTLELTFRHNNDVAQFELDVVGSNWDDVRILDRSEADKVIHCFILDCERRIAIRIVLTMDCVGQSSNLAKVCFHLLQPCCHGVRLQLALLSHEQRRMTEEAVQ